MVIKAIKDISYGAGRIIVVDKEQRKAISLLTGKQTLLKNEKKGIDHIKGLEMLGHVVEIVGSSLDVEIEK